VQGRREGAALVKSAQHYFDDRALKIAVNKLKTHSAKSKHNKQAVLEGAALYVEKRLKEGIAGLLEHTRRRHVKKHIHSKISKFRLSKQKEGIEEIFGRWFDLTQEKLKMRRMETMADTICTAVLLRKIVEGWFEWVRTRHRRSKLADVVRDTITDKGVAGRTLIRWRASWEIVRNERLCQNLRFKQLAGNTLNKWREVTSETLKDKKKGEAASSLFRASILKLMLKEWRHACLYLARARKVLLMRCVGGWRLLVDSIKDSREMAEEMWLAACSERATWALSAWAARTQQWKEKKGGMKLAEEAYDNWGCRRALATLCQVSRIQLSLRDKETRVKELLALKSVELVMVSWLMMSRWKKLNRSAKEMGARCISKRENIIKSTIFRVWWADVEEARVITNRRKIERHVRERVDRFAQYTQMRNNNGAAVARILEKGVARAFLKEWRRRVHLLIHRDLVFEWWVEISATEKQARLDREARAVDWLEKKWKINEARCFAEWRKFAAKRARTMRVGADLRISREHAIVVSVFADWASERKSLSLVRKGDEYFTIRQMEHGFFSLVELLDAKRMRTTAGDSRRSAGIELVRRVSGRISWRTFTSWSRYVRVVRRSRFKEKARVDGGRKFNLIVTRWTRRVLHKAFETIRVRAHAEVERENDMVREFRMKMGLVRWRMKCSSKIKSRNTLMKNIVIGDDAWQKKRAIWGFARLRDWGVRKIRLREGSKAAMDRWRGGLMSRMLRNWKKHVRVRVGVRSVSGKVMARMLRSSIEVLGHVLEKWSAHVKYMKRVRSGYKGLDRVFVMKAWRDWREWLVEGKDWERRVEEAGRIMGRGDDRLVNVVLGAWKRCVDERKELALGGYRKFVFREQGRVFGAWKKAVFGSIISRNCFAQWHSASALMVTVRKKGKAALRIAFNKVFVFRLFYRLVAYSRERVGRRRAFVGKMQKRAEAKAWAQWIARDAEIKKMNNALSVWDKFDRRRRGFAEKDEKRIREVEVRVLWGRWRKAWEVDAERERLGWEKAVKHEDAFVKKRAFFGLSLGRL
jgi:hypothetical protein